jgi:hypothetical protein
VPAIGDRARITRSEGPVISSAGTVGSDTSRPGTHGSATAIWWVFVVIQRSSTMTLVEWSDRSVARTVRTKYGGRTNLVEGFREVVRGDVHALAQVEAVGKVSLHPRV